MSDFFGEYFAPGAFFTGAAITGYKSFKELKQSNSVKSIWTAHKESNEAFENIKAARRHQRVLSHDEIIDNFFFKTNPWRQFQGFRQFNSGKNNVKKGLAFIKGRALESMIHQFQLGENARAIGLDLKNLHRAKRSQVKELLELSPKHAEFMERAVASYGIKMGSGSNLEGRAANVADTIMNTRRAFIDSFKQGRTIADVIEGNTQLFESLSPNRFAGKSIKIMGSKDLNRLKQLGRADSDELIAKANELFNKVQAMRKSGAPMNMQLLTMTQHGQRQIRGIRISSGKGQSVLDIPLVNNQGRVRVGFYGQREMIARKVGLSDYSSFFQAGSGAPARNFDLAAMDNLIEHFDSFNSKKGSWFKFLRELEGSHSDDVGRVLLPVTANESYNMKIAQQATFAENALNGKINIEAIDEIAIKRNIDPISGLSPTQITSGVRAMRDVDERIIGVGPFGTSSGDDKTLAQMTKPKVMVTPSKARATVVGIQQSLMGDINSQIRNYSIPEDIMRVLLSESSRSDIGLHEDIAILLGDTRRTFMEVDSRVISAGSLGSELALDLLEGDHYSALRDAAISEGGVEGRLAQLRQMEAQAVDPDVKRSIIEHRTKLETDRRLLQDEILGELPHGGITRGAKEGDFLINKMNYISRTGTSGEGKLMIEGFKTRELDTFDKTYGWKRVVSGKIAPNEGRYMAAVFEATKDTPEVRQALRDIGSSDSAVSQQAKDFIEDKYARFMDHYRRESIELIRQDKGLPSLARMSVPGIADDIWQTAVSRVQDIEALDVQGYKKIAQRTMGNAAASLTSGLANELVRLKSQRMTPADPKDMQAFMRAQEHNQEIYRKVTALQDSLERIGVRGIQDGTFYIDDAVHLDPTGSKNLANRMDQILIETMEEGTTHGAHRWSAKQLLKDLETSDHLTKAMKERMNSWSSLTSEEAAFEVRDMIVKGGKTRNAVYQELQRQLQWGAHTSAFSVGGSSRFTGGSGRAGSINSTMLGHLKEQGGVMAELSDELAGRIKNTNITDGKEVVKRIAAFHKPEILNDVQSISMRELINKNQIDSGTIQNLFGRNQVARSQAFADIRSQFNIEDGEGLVFDLGEEGGGKKIYQPEKISQYSGAFTEDSGRAAVSDIDKSLNEIMKGFKAQNADKIAEAMESYDKALSEISFGKKQALSKLTGGKVQGSVRALAVPQRGTDFLEALDPGNFNQHRLGMTEKRFEMMLDDIGVHGQERIERMSRFRKGTEAAIIARQPGTELHRISNVNLYSVDEMFRRARVQMASHWDHVEIIDQIKHLNPKAYYENIDRFNDVFDSSKTFKNPKKLAKRQADFWAKIWEKEMMSNYDDHAVYLPKQIEQILGADFDDDQLDVFLAKQKKLNERLSARASYQTDLISGKRKVGDATQAWELLAEEDFVYKENQRALYKGLKDNVRPETLTEESLKTGTQAWRDKMKAQTLMAQFEKGYIGGMTNSTDFIRDILRVEGKGKITGEARLFTEMLLGIIPETALKARQHGPSALMNPEYGLEEGIKTLKGIMAGEFAEKGVSKQAQIDLFNDAFRSVHGKSELTDKMLKFTPRVIDAVKGAGSRPQNILSKILKKTPEQAQMKDLLRYALDPDVPSVQRAAFMDAIQEMGGNIRSDTVSGHMKKAAASFNEVFGAIKRNKNPILIGTAVAASAAMFLSSPDSISAAEADAAGARHTPSERSSPPAEFNNSTPVSTGNGRSIRIRGRADGNIDTSALSERIQAKFPGADVSYTLNDFRERINEEYLRKRFER